MANAEVQSPSAVRYLLGACLFLAGLIVIVGTNGCSSSGQNDSRPISGTIEILDVCLKKKGTSAVYADRLRNVAELLRTKLDAGNKSWDYIGLTEAWYKNVDPAGVNEYHLAQPIPCYAIDDETMTADCFDLHLKDPSPGDPPLSSNLTDQYGDVALIAKDGRLSLEGSLHKDRLDAYTLLGIGDSIEYSIIGGRFRIMDSSSAPSEYIVPIYSIHLPTATSSDENRGSQLWSMIEKIKNWWVPGDMTPILVGDFNVEYTGGDDPDLETALRKDFTEAWKVLPNGYSPSIIGIWVGHESNFPGAKGTMVFSDYEQWKDFDDYEGDDSFTLTDHPVMYAKLRPLAWSFTKTYDTIPSRFQSAAGPTLFAPGTGVYLAWSDSEAGGRISVAHATGAEPPPFGARHNVFRPGQAEPIASEFSPALTRFQQKYFIAWVPAGQHLHVMSTETGPSNEHGWTNHKRFERTTDGAPALTATDNTLFMAWKEEGGERIYLAKSTDGWNWSTSRIPGARTDAAPAIAFYQDKLCAAWSDTDEQHIRVMLYDDDRDDWNDAVRIPYARSESGPSLLAVHKEERVVRRPGETPKDRLYLMWGGIDNEFLQIMSSPDGVDWSHAKRAIEGISAYRPSLAYYEGKFVIGWTGIDDEPQITLKGSRIGGEISIDVDN